MNKSWLLLLIYGFIYCPASSSSKEVPIKNENKNTSVTLGEYTTIIADASLWLYRNFEQFYKNNVDNIIPYLRQYVDGVNYSMITLEPKHKNYLQTPEALFTDQRYQRPKNVTSFDKFVKYAASCIDTSQLPVFNKVPRIAFCGSGGGYRAMIFNSGYMAGLQHIFLNDSILFTSSLSGSTWYMAPWMISKKTEIEYQRSLAQKIQDGTFSLLSPKLKSFEFKSFFESVLWPKIVFNQPIDIIDIYGGMLSYILFYDKVESCFKQYMSHQLNELSDYEKPFPLYTAVSMYKNNDDQARYQWYEFNPFNAVNLETNLSLPIYAFGSKFDKGKNQQLAMQKGLFNAIAPEQSLGYFLGMFGSAISINYADIERIMINPALKKSSNSLYDQAKNKIFQFTLKTFKDQLGKLKDIVPTSYKEQTNSAINFLNNDRTKYLRAAAAQVNNPFKGMKEVSSWLAQKDTISLIDGGIAYNIPIRPLMTKEREIDVIIIGDSSGDTQEGNEITKMFEDLKQQGYSYKEFFLEDKKTAELIRYSNARFFRDVSSNAPVILYFNFLVDKKLFASTKDPELKRLITEYKLNDFDVQECLSKECGTFNFDYTPQQFWRNTKLTELIMRCHAPTILTILAQLFADNDQLEEEIDF